MRFRQGGPRPLRPEASSEKPDPYEVLGVSRRASDAEIKAAYRKAMMSAHPDQGGSTDGAQTINRAFEILKNKDTRDGYDRYGHAFFDNNRAHHDPFEAWNDIFKTHSPRGNDSPDELARGLGFKDFADYVEQSARKKEARKTDRSIIVKEAVGRARFSASAFGDHIEELKREGIPNVTQLINEEAVTQEIIGKALEKANFGASFYDSYVAEWAKKCGFDRKKSDLHSSLLDLILKQSISKLDFSVQSLKTYLQDWAEHNPNFNRVSVTNHPEVLRIVATEAARRKSAGSYMLASFLDECRSAGIDVSRFKV